MPNIKPVSDLRNYTEVLKEFSTGSPVYFTKNGRGEFVIAAWQGIEWYQSIRMLLLNFTLDRLVYTGKEIDE